MFPFDSYASEANRRWGDTEAWREYTEKTKGEDPQKRQARAAEMDAIMAEFAACKQSGAQPASPEAQALVEKLQLHISENYYACSKEMLACLGQMYVLDERFERNIDRHGPGTALYVCNAIIAACTPKEE